MFLKKKMNSMYKKESSLKVVNRIRIRTVLKQAGVFFEQLPVDIEWHFVGHLQSNKVKSLLGTIRFFSFSCLFSIMHLLVLL